MNDVTAAQPIFPPWPQFDDQERAGLIRALEQGAWWRMGGQEVRLFEQEFADYNGAPYALAVTNGTHALELGLQLLGVGPGTEVIVPAFTFISSSQAAQRLGATAVPVDIDPHTYCIDVTAAESAIGPRTRAIMPVHMAGQVADMDALAKLSAHSEVPILQDAAHAQGAQWQGQRIGALGSIAAFSFQNGKLMTAGEGGALTVADAETHHEAFLRHSCGRPAEDRQYMHIRAGSNFRMNEFSAAVLRAQLHRLDGQTEIREQRAAVLTSLLADIPGVEPQQRDRRCDRNPHYMMMFRLPGITEEQRNATVDTLVERGLPAFIAFRPVYRTEGFWETGAPDVSVDDLATSCHNAEAVSRECIWLHHRVLLGSPVQMQQVADIIAAVVSGR